MEIEDSEDEIQDELMIKETDWILMAGKIEQEFSSLEIYVYDSEQGNLFVHHDLILSSFPVCLEWLGANLF